MRKKTKETEVANDSVIRESEIEEKLGELSFKPSEDGKEIIFSVNGTDKLKMAKEQFMRLIEVGVMMDFFKVAEQGPETFDLKDYVFVLRLMRKGLDFFAISKVMGIPEPQIRRRYNATNQAESRIQAERRRQVEEEGERDYVKKVPYKDVHTGAVKGGEDFIDLRILKSHIFRQGKNLKDIAKMWSLDQKDFNDFYEKNKIYLDLLR